MQTPTTIREIFRKGTVYVPSYQRAYSWDTENVVPKPSRQVNTFLNDLEDFIKSNSKSAYYFGHFLFEQKDTTFFGIIDGQQRLTTIVIFISALFHQLMKIRPLTENEQQIYEDIIGKKPNYRFKTVDYDNQFFKDYVIDQSTKNKNNLKTLSAKRVVDAFDFFSSKLADKDEEYLLEMLDVLQKATCTTHYVEDESQAIQMFLFQNNRGKKPTNLEIIKAQFMFTIHIYGAEDTETLLQDSKERFEKIYKSISFIENRINEDEILVYVLRVYFNSLSETNAIERIDKELSKENPVLFVESFSQLLAESFDYLMGFFGKDERENSEIHSLVTLGGIGLAMPFIIKAYKFGLPISQINELCKSLESILLRHRLISTRANIVSRLNEKYQKFTLENHDIQPIIEHINWLKNDVPKDSWWWNYWSNIEFEQALRGNVYHTTAKYLLWKYENHLESQGKKGYQATRFDKIDNPELEHIAPQTENTEAGYDTYDDEFKNLLNCLGNYLLLPKSHNASIGNKSFKEKRNSYNHFYHQREIQSMTDPENPKWTKEHIRKRNEKIVRFVLDYFK